MTQAVARQEKQGEVIEHQAPVSDTMAFLEVFERAIRDPSVDVGKARELMAMRKEIFAEQASQEWDEAMTEVQKETRPIAADANNPQTKSKYASYLALDKVLRPIYTKHGFNLGFNTADGAPADHVRVICDVARKGHTRRFQIDMPADGKGAKGGDVMTKTHATGSATRYGMRYLLNMIFNIAVGTDDDGNAAGGTELISPEQLQEIIDLADEVGADKIAFCKAMNVEALADITKARYGSALAKLHTKRAQAARKAATQ